MNEANDSYKNLPKPDDASRAHSAQLVTHIARVIDEAGGWIPFSHYMQLALYTPQLGYYASDLPKLGAPQSGADFITAPELSSLFGATLARSLAAIMQHSAPQVLEFGAGSGKLAIDVLQTLHAMDALPERYFIVELSATLRDRQRACIAAALPQLVDRIEWLDALPSTFSGAMLANEVLDAMPVAQVEWCAGQHFEHGVSLENGQLMPSKRPINGLLQAYMANMPMDWAGSVGTASYMSEIGLEGQAWTRTLAQCLQRGAALLVDYGFPAHEFYHPQRDQGTLMCHYRHYAHQDPLWMPGLCDITAHVDFSAIAYAAHDAGAQLLGYATHASYLLDAGLLEALGEANADPNQSDAQRFARNNQVQRLTSPAEMGELFKVLCFGKGVDSIPGFRRNDRSHTL
jgi:SAM-dependent MidA family methyltransferase